MSRASRRLRSRATWTGTNTTCSWWASRWTARGISRTLRNWNAVSPALRRSALRRRAAPASPSCLAAAPAEPWSDPGRGPAPRPCRSMSSFPSSTAPSARTAPCRACWRWPACPMWEPACSEARWAWTRKRRRPYGYRRDCRPFPTSRSGSPSGRPATKRRHCWSGRSATSCIPFSSNRPALVLPWARARRTTARRSSWREMKPSHGTTRSWWNPSYLPAKWNAPCAATKRSKPIRPAR